MLIGVTGRYKAPIEVADIEAIQVAKIEAVKVTYLGLEQGTELFTVMQPPSGPGFAPTVEEAYKTGVRWFIIHKHPNRGSEGWGEYWQNGAQFADWWVSVCGQLREKFPEAKWGFPALTQGDRIGSFREDSEKFWKECMDAIEFADFCEVEAWWKKPQGMQESLERIASLVGDWPDKPFTVEFCNYTPVVLKTEKAQQYLAFYDAMAQLPNVKAAFAFCVSSADSQYHRYVCWRAESGKKVPSVIAEIVGRREVK